MFLLDFEVNTLGTDDRFKPPDLTKFCKWKAANIGKVRAYAHADYLRHRDERLAGRKAWRLKNPDYMKTYSRAHKAKLEQGGRNRTYKRKYGITVFEYEQMLAQQNECSPVYEHNLESTRLELVLEYLYPDSRIYPALENSVVMGQDAILYGVGYIEPKDTK